MFNWDLEPEKTYKLIPHTEDFEGGALERKFEETTYTIKGTTETDDTNEAEEKDKWLKGNKGKKFKAWSNIKFKDYDYHGVDTNNKLPLNRDSMTSDEHMFIQFLKLKYYSYFNNKITRDKLNSYPLAYAGNKVTDYFNEHIRNNTQNKKGDSLNSLWNDLEKRKRIYEDSYALKRQLLYLRGDYNHETAQRDIFSKLTASDLKGALQMSVFSNNQFKPFIAKLVYSYFKDNIYEPKSILDFSAGWGGRMLGAMAMNPSINYIGIDPNTELFDTLRDMMNKVNRYCNKGSKYELLNAYGEEVDYSKLDYDFVLTSPPYADEEGKQIENYVNMRDYTGETFYSNFLIPTIYRIFRYLPVDKYICININRIGMETLKQMFLPEEDFVIPYRTKERAGQQAKRTEGKSEKKRYTEMIYCFKKTKDTMDYLKRKLRDIGLSVSDKPPKENIRRIAKTEGTFDGRFYTKTGKETSPKNFISSEEQKYRKQIMYLYHLDNMPHNEMCKLKRSKQYEIDLEDEPEEFVEEVKEQLAEKTCKKQKGEVKVAEPIKKEKELKRDDDVLRRDDDIPSLSYHKPTAHLTKKYNNQSRPSSTGLMSFKRTPNPTNRASAVAGGGFNHTLPFGKQKNKYIL